MQKVRMLKTLYPEGIPNGTIGKSLDSDDIKGPGLHRAIFNGFSVLVYPHEVELVENSQNEQAHNDNDRCDWGYIKSGCALDCKIECPFRDQEDINQWN